MKHQRHPDPRKQQQLWERRRQRATKAVANLERLEAKRRRADATAIDLEKEARRGLTPEQVRAREKKARRKAERAGQDRGVRIKGLRRTRRRYDP